MCPKITEGGYLPGSNVYISNVIFGLFKRSKQRKSHTFNQHILTIWGLSGFFSNLFSQYSRIWSSLKSSYWLTTIGLVELFTFLSNWSNSVGRTHRDEHFLGHLLNAVRCPVLHQPVNHWKNHSWAFKLNKLFLSSKVKLCCKSWKVFTPLLLSHQYFNTEYSNYVIKDFALVS